MPGTTHVRQAIDPQLRNAHEAFLIHLGPRGFHEIPDLARRRQRYSDVMSMAAKRAPNASLVRRADYVVPGASGPDVPVRVYFPVGLHPGGPAVLFLHGGGRIMGSVADEDGRAAQLALDVGAVVVSVEYGLAPERPGRGQVVDCYNALTWMTGNQSELGIDNGQIALVGDSAGGGLACGLSLLARERGGPVIAFQMLIYPMLDDRNTSCSSHRITHLGIWDREANVEAWHHVLGAAVGSDNVDPVVAPARATDLRGLPPTYVDVGDLDVFHDESVDLASRLREAGVPVELHVYRGAFHGFDSMVPRSELAATARTLRTTALRTVLGTNQRISNERTSHRVDD